jgi:hypothetical protein
MIAAPFHDFIVTGQRVARGWVSFFSQTFPIIAPNPVGGSTTTNPRAITSTTTTANPFTYQNTSGFYQWISAWSAVAGIQYQFSRDGSTYYNLTGTTPAQAAGVAILAPLDYFRIQTGGSTVNYVVVPL